MNRLAHSRQRATMAGDCEGPMSRSCTCGGNNENCMFCFGSGVVEGPRVVPPLVPAARRSRGRRIARRARTRAGTRSCPVCGVAVQRLEQHLRKVHGEQDKLIPETIPPVLASTEAVSKRPVPSPKMLSSLPVGGLGYVFCRICRRQVKQDEIVEHLIYAHHLQGQPLDRAVAVHGHKKLPPESQRPNHPQKPALGSPEPPDGSAVTSAASHSSRVLPEQFTICSQCGARLLTTGIQRHFNKVHGKKRVAAASDVLLSGVPDRRKTAVPPDQLKNPIFQERLSRAMDGTRDYAHSFREKGRYGSHPSHDDYDEGKP